MKYTIPFSARRATPNANAAEISASNRLSTSSCQTTRRRDAPIESRMPISRWRASKRASNRFATFAQPIKRMRPNANNSGMNTNIASAGRGTVPSRGSSTRLAAARSSPRRRLDTRYRSHARSCASACSLATRRAQAARRSPRPPRPFGALPLMHGRAQRAAAPRSRVQRRPRAPEAFRHDADDLELRAVHAVRAADARPGRSRNAAPGPDGSRTMTGGRPGSSSEAHERAPPCGGHAEHAEKIARDEAAFAPDALDPARASPVLANASPNTAVSRSSARSAGT